MMKNVKGNFRVWHIPQVGADAIFRLHCNSLEEAYRIQSILAVYDIFEYHNRIKPDFSNASGIEIYDEEEQEWCDYYNEDGLDPDELYEDDKEMQDWINKLMVEN